MIFTLVVSLILILIAPIAGQEGSKGIRGGGGGGGGQMWMYGGGGKWAKGGGSGGGCGLGNGGGGNKDFEAVQSNWQKLIQNRHDIKRKVVPTGAGVKTRTWFKSSASNTNEKNKWIIHHIEDMTQFMNEGRFLRCDDPVFRALFEQASKMILDCKLKDGKVRCYHNVTTEDRNGCAVDVIQSHANLVSLFLKNGPAEVHSFDHEVDYKNDDCE